MKSIQDYLFEDNKLDENQLYDNIINKLQESKENNIPLEEGIFSGIFLGAAGLTIGPRIMRSVCEVLGIDPKGSLGSLMTSRLILTAMGAKLGFRV